jgi:predicted  nucleic acid-binding Zn-ribbon protein
MGQELQQFNQENMDLTMNITELKYKLKTAENEVYKEREKWKKIASNIKQFKIELNECIQHIQDPKDLKVNLHCGTDS